MSPQSLPHERILAALLPLCLVWVFVACAALCLLYGEGARWPHAPHGAACAAGPPPPDDCCPETEALTVALPGRHSHDLEEALAAPCSALSALRGPEAHTSSCSPRGAPRCHTSDPPFARLRVLRI